MLSSPLLSRFDLGKTPVIEFLSYNFHLFALLNLAFLGEAVNSCYGLHHDVLTFIEGQLERLA